MSIDKQIKGLEYLKKCGIFPFSDTRTGIVFTEEYISDAIETMRKYQKIQEVMDSRPDDDAKSNSKALGEIEVIIYGNDNDWNKIDLHIIEQKKKKIVSTKDALKDIIPYPIEEGSMDDGKNY